MDKKTKKSNIKKPLKWGRNQRYMKEFPENKIDVTVTEKKDKERKESYISLISLTKDILLSCIDLLGIECPERM